MDERLQRMLFRLARTVSNGEHPVRRLRAAVDALYENGRMTEDRVFEITLELEQLEHGVNAGNDAIEQLAGRLRAALGESHT